MPISSLIIRTDPQKVQMVTDYIRTFKEATVAQVHDENIVVITETQSQKEDKCLWESLEKYPGVIQCDLIYHNFEDEEEFDND